MIIIEGRNFRQCHANLTERLRTAPKVRTEKWQGVQTRPGMETYELEDVILEFPMGTADLNYQRFQIGPNLPWADDHFVKDRMSGQPLNPGLTWQDWPYALKADGFREIKKQGWEDGFNHTYAERYWPKHAGLSDHGIVDQGLLAECPARRGVRYNYGDVGDLIALLSREPLTRQAYLPVFFPEDTGSHHGGRTPCTLGYLFRVRDGKLNVAYYIRSCDFVRHFKDDVYLTVRLALWIIERCASQNAAWLDIRPGRFMMHVGSMHVFVNDWDRLFRTGEQDVPITGSGPAGPARG